MLPTALLIPVQVLQKSPLFLEIISLAVWTLPLLLVVVVVVH